MLRWLRIANGIVDFVVVGHCAEISQMKETVKTNCAGPKSTKKNLEIGPSAGGT
jgi:hypothetical protein